MAKHTLQTLLQTHLSEVLKVRKFPLYQLKALERFSVCRTSKLGGHAQYCENGHLDSVWYNSCKHRSCPQCQNLAKAQWLKNQQRLLLDCPHHHVIFTLPHELNNLWRYNREVMSDLLFKCTQATLFEFSRDRRHLGAKPGMVAALHTWGRNLSLHPHIHVLISHGGLGDNGEWVLPKKEILFPQKPIMMVFRGKFLSILKGKLAGGELVIPPDRRTSHIWTLLNKLGRSAWVVHFCKQYVHGEGVVKYLSSYVKGGAFNNDQIKSIKDGRVNFIYKSHQTKRTELLNLSVKEFIERVVEHILPPGKCGVRYSGLYSSSARAKLNIARQEFGQTELTGRIHLHWEEYLEEMNQVLRCSQCNALMLRREVPDQQLCA